MSQDPKIDEVVERIVVNRVESIAAGFQKIFQLVVGLSVVTAGVLFTLHNLGILRARAASRGIVAILPRSGGVGQYRRTAPAGSVESLERRGHPVAHTHPRAGPLESHRVGRSRVRDDGDQQPRQCDLQTGTVWRRRRLGGSIDAPLASVCHRQADGADPMDANGSGG